MTYFSHQKKSFEAAFRTFVTGLTEHIGGADGRWTIKGFIDLYKKIYTSSHDTKIISKILEIHIVPKLLDFATAHGYKLVLADHQNYYPDISFISDADATLRFAVDFKTTYRNLEKPHLCNGFTLGSHGKYFEDRTSTKNIQFPYGSYQGHYCLGIIYERTGVGQLDETKIFSADEISPITSVAGNFQLFFIEKWRIASDKPGSGNTANIGSINHISDILAGKGMFSLLGEAWFDDCWKNYGKIIVKDEKGGSKKISNLKEFVRYKNGDVTLVVPKRSGRAGCQ